jgi:uroporphyrinogen-III decarboxylase
MAENISPRQILRAVLQGDPPARPLFAPIAFSLAARVENLALPIFLANPTKVSNALRQIRSPLRTDAVSCYFDPLLEMEALGYVIEWMPEIEQPRASWPSGALVGELPSGLSDPADVIKRGRVPVALEIIRRLKALFREESLLMVGVSGPFTLATRLTNLFGASVVTRSDISNAALEVSAAVVAQISKSFAAAGANLIFLREEFAPTLDARALGEWTSMLTPVVNVIRFYEALPVLQFKKEIVPPEDLEAVLSAMTGSVFCPPLPTLRRASAEKPASISSSAVGLSLEFQFEDASFQQALKGLIRDLRPAIVTTASDLPPTIDPQRVAAFADLVRSSS